ncbi:uncharacterized protein ISCGN_027306 [Ixodes scapularis]
MLAKVVSLEKGQKATDISVQQLLFRRSPVEAKLAVTDTASETPLEPYQGIFVELASTQKQCEDNENCLRISNILFLVALVTKPKRGAIEKKKKIQICAQNLGIALDPSNLESSHRLGKFDSERTRPIIVKFAKFMVNIFSSGFS